MNLGIFRAFLERISFASLLNRYDKSLKLNFPFLKLKTCPWLEISGRLLTHFTRLDVRSSDVSLPQTGYLDYLDYMND